MYQRVAFTRVETSSQSRGRWRWGTPVVSGLWGSGKTKWLPFRILQGSGEPRSSQLTRSRLRGVAMCGRAVALEVPCRGNGSPAVIERGQQGRVRARDQNNMWWNFNFWLVLWFFRTIYFSLNVFWDYSNLLLSNVLHLLLQRVGSIRPIVRHYWNRLPDGSSFSTPKPAASATESGGW